MRWRCGQLWDADGGVTESDTERRRCRKGRVDRSCPPPRGVGLMEKKLEEAGGVWGNRGGGDDGEEKVAWCLG